MSIISNKNNEWTPGLYVSAKFSKSASDKKLTIPASALQNLEGEDVVFIPSGTGFIAKPVKVGRQTGAQVETG